jgi:hypothetical protein
LYQQTADVQHLPAFVDLPHWSKHLRFASACCWHEEVLKMSVQGTITKFLHENRKVDFCDDCIAVRLSLKRRQQAQTVTAALSETEQFYRTSGRYSGCGKTKIVIHSV